MIRRAMLPLSATVQAQNRKPFDTDHEERRDDPVDDYAEAELYPDLSSTKNFVQFLVLNFT